MPLDRSAAPLRLHAALPASGDVLVASKPNETEVTHNRWELGYAPIDGSFPARRLHPALPAGGTVAVGFSVDRPFFRLVGSHAVAFRASLMSASSMELWLTSLMRSGPIANAPAAPGAAPSVRVP